MDSMGTGHDDIPSVPPARRTPREVLKEILDRADSDPEFRKKLEEINRNIDKLGPNDHTYQRLKEGHVTLGEYLIGLQHGGNIQPLMDGYAQQLHGILEHAKQYIEQKR